MLLFHRDPSESRYDSIERIRAINQIINGRHSHFRTQIFNYSATVFAIINPIAVVALERQPPGQQLSGGESFNEQRPPACPRPRPNRSGRLSEQGQAS